MYRSSQQPTANSTNPPEARLSSGAEKSSPQIVHLVLSLACGSGARVDPVVSISMTGSKSKASLCFLPRRISYPMQQITRKAMPSIMTPQPHRSSGTPKTASAGHREGFPWPLQEIRISSSVQNQYPKGGCEAGNHPPPPLAGGGSERRRRRARELREQGAVSQHCPIGIKEPSVAVSQADIVIKHSRRTR
ncbi:hypothetical protein MGYG_08992 [Nannizzia gypsea CBS 118893]|uniref:Uncharacterized protein n=1 Tax=Arthroderma gypseum (strain ATCC MYA-4604 / CBS 118893) TaxID=535722 RepID=E4UNK5_ARTGP|nr:hypothetical protein MGYG_08992 [Nannizzia gypsea CBS 118893]EFQ99613.1 hypothetical protein MGYG_08992 [Nannizzia gypsea CBS 118893]